MVRIAAIGAALVALVAAAPAVPAGAQVSRISDANPFGAPFGAFPSRTAEWHHHHHATPTPTPSPISTPTPGFQHGRPAKGHGFHLPTNILPRLFRRSEPTPSGIESNGHRGEKGSGSPEFPGASSKTGHHASYLTPTPTPHHSPEPTPLGGHHHHHHTQGAGLPNFSDLPHMPIPTGAPGRPQPLTGGGLHQ